MSVARTVSWNVLVQLGSRAAQLALSGIATLVIVRSLGPAQYGQYAFVIALISVCGLIAEGGIDRIVTRDISVNVDEEATLLPLGILTHMIFGLLAAIAAVVAAFVLHLDNVVRVGVTVASVIFFFDGVSSVGVIFQARLAMQYDALSMIGGKVVFAAVVALSAWRQAPVLAYVLAPVSSSLVMALLALYFSRRFTHLRWQVDVVRLRRLMSDCIPSGLALFIAVLYLKLDGVLLGILVGSTALGLYSAAYRPVEYLLLAASVIVSPVYPLLSRTFGTDPERFLMIYQRSFLTLLLGFTPIIALSVVFAPQLLGLVFGPEYVTSATPYRLLMLVLPLLACNGWQALAMLSANRQAITVRIDAVGLVVNITANLLLIPRLGAVGCALAALMTALVVSSSGNVAARRIAGASFPGAVLLRLVAVGVIGATVMRLASPLIWPVAGALGIAVYVALLPVFHLVDLDEIRLLLSPPRSAIAASDVP